MHLDGNKKTGVMTWIRKQKTLINVPKIPNRFMGNEKLCRINNF